MSSSTSSSELGLLAQRRTGGPKAFLFAALATAAIGLALLWVVAAELREGFMSDEYAMWITKQRMVEQCQLSPTLILGDSRAVAGFVPKQLGDATNLALGGATPIEMFYMASRALACPQPHRQVVMSLSPSQLMDGEYFWPRTALFDFLSFSDLEQIRKLSRALGDTLLFAPPAFADVDAIINDWLYAHNFPSFSAAAMFDHAIIGRLRANTRIERDIEASGGQHGYGTRSGSDEIADDALLAGFHVAPIYNAYFDRLLTMLEQHGSRVLFIAVPMNDATYAAMSPQVVRGFDDYLRGLAARHPNFQLVGDPIAHMDNRYFGDDTHLNAEGADLFSADVRTTLASH